MTRQITEVRHDFIPLKGGLRLAYRAWLPADAHRHPVPAILEFLPYRKNDGTTYRDEITMPATAAHGYACIRVDIRGTGESDGFFDDEYSEQELADAEEVIHWLSQRDWCDGNVGMVGISWGGFNALQLAFRQPPALKAIISICSSDDRFNEDVHFAGGCLLNDNLDWAAFFWSYAQARCPDPRLVGDEWRQRWLQRLHRMPFLADRWIGEQSKSRYWRHGSVSEDYSRIRTPVYAMGGWADAYRNTVFRLLENLSAPCKALIGPWAHKYPNIAYPGPRIDYVRESVRWWDRWLKGIDNGIMSEPRLHYYLMDSVRPATDYAFRAGRWQSEASWPSADITLQCYYLHPGILSTEAPRASHDAVVASPASTGQAAGKLMVGIGHEQEFAADQRPDDAASLVFDTAPLPRAINIVGQPRLCLTVCCDRPLANIAARLCDVHPSGESTLVTYGVLNLAHRDSNESPQPMAIGQSYEVELPLHHIAYRIPDTHRLRLSISNAYWPLIWPSPERGTLTIALSSSQFMLPVKPALETVDNPALQPFDGTPMPEEDVLRPPHTSKTVTEDPETGHRLIETSIDYGHCFLHSCATSIDFTVDQRVSIHPDEPCSAISTNCHRVTMQQGETLTRLQAYYEMTCSESRFYIKARWQAWEADACLVEKEFNHAIQRHLL